MARENEHEKNGSKVVTVYSNDSNIARSHISFMAREGQRLDRPDGGCDHEYMWISSTITGKEAAGEGFAELQISD